MLKVMLLTSWVLMKWLSMNKKYAKILADSKTLMENMDSDVFLDKFLELQKQNKVTNMKYVVMTNGCGAFGSGDGKNEAIDNAMKWLEPDDESRIVDVEVVGSRVRDASIYVVKCPDEYFNYVISDGSSCYYDKDKGLICDVVIYD